MPPYDRVYSDIMVFAATFYYIIEHLGSSCDACVWNVAVLMVFEIFDSVLSIS